MKEELEKEKIQDKILICKEFYMIQVVGVAFLFHGGFRDEKRRQRSSDMLHYSTLSMLEGNLSNCYAIIFANSDAHG
jgi:hypothetical protein